MLWPSCLNQPKWDSWCLDKLKFLSSNIHSEQSLLPLEMLRFPSDYKGTYGWPVIKEIVLHLIRKWVAIDSREPRNLQTKNTTLLFRKSSPKHRKYVTGYSPIFRCLKSKYMVTLIFLSSSNKAMTKRNWSSFCRSIHLQLTIMIP